MKKILLPALLLCSMLTALQSQELVEAEFLVSYTKTDLQNQFGSFIEYGADLYRVLYTTQDVHGVPDTASGLLVVPNQDGLSYPLLCYQHGTVNSREDVPFHLQGGYQLALVFGAMGYITTAADFLGLGEARGFHPYVHADSEAWAAVDMLYAAGDFMDQQGIAYHNQLFLTGYSQGGHASMALHRLIEDAYADEFELAAASHMSGPYDISGAMVEFTLGDTEYFFPGYLANVALSFQTVYGIYDDLYDFFKTEYADKIQQYYEEQITLSDVNDFMITKLTQDYGGSIPKYMLQDSILNALLNDPTHPASQALAANDVFDWTPAAPTRIVYCQADDQVYYRNSVVADSVMKENGALLVDRVNVNANADHGGCVEPAANFTLIFFSFLQDVVDLVDVEAQQTFEAQLSLHPNPATDWLQVEVRAWPTPELSYQILDLSGKVVATGSSNASAVFQIHISHLPEGLYAIQLNNGAQQYSQIFLKNE
ncbi:MAG: T9SS type A sorting domain-containing protein [Phaeodactylibacter sp.]|nr:T9SS type A sorting domain-containing protein [Phaeodactylibacter sp.]